MRGGDFWQGAAAGFVSSFAGSAAQGVGIHGWGMVGISSASGGVGAAIAGGKAEEILFGMVQGAMVGVLNHLQGERQKELTIREKVGKLATSLGISVEAKNALIEWAIKGGKAADVEKYLVYSKGLGRLCGLVAIGSDLINLKENPSTANKIRLGVDIALLLVGPEASAVAGILDISGISDKIYEYLGNGVDNSIMGLRNTYNNIQQFANPINWMPNL